MTLARRLTIAVGVVTVGWLVILVMWGPAPFAFSFDDAFYYYTIGRNWAQGHASTFDLIDRTNGYHPLWQLISIIPFLLGLDGLAAVRFLLVLQLLFWAGAMVLVAGIVGRVTGDWPRLADHPSARRFCATAVTVGFVIVCANPYLFKMTVNGLESGLVVPVGAALLVVALRFRGRFVSQASARQRWASGALLACAFGARTDAVILVAVVALAVLHDARRAKVAPKIVARAAVELFTIPVVTIAAYLAVNRAVFGTVLQISGTVKRLPITPLRGVVALVWGLIGIGVLIAVNRPIKRSSRLRSTRRFLAATGWYATFCVGLVGYYSTLQEVPYLWYFAPLALYGTVLVLLLIADLAEGAALEAAAANRATTGASVVAPAAILLVPLAVALAWTIPMTRDPGTRALMVHDAAAGRWIAAHLPPDARIASWDAGALGYFAHRRVVNLDGVVNSVEWYDAVRQRRTGPFLADRDVDWVANHGGAVAGRDPDIDAQIRGFFGNAAARTIRVVYADIYRFSGTLDGSRTDTSNKRMGTYVYRLGR